MPWFVWLIIVGASTSLLGPPRAWDPVDPTTKNKRGAPVTGFSTSLSVTSTTFARRNAQGEYACKATLFAISLGQRRVRVQIDGIEQPIDWSWNYDVSVVPEERRTIEVKYIDPKSGEILAIHTQSFLCAYGREENR